MVRLSYYTDSPSFFIVRNYERDSNLQSKLKENRGHRPMQMKEKPGTGR